MCARAVGVRGDIVLRGRPSVGLTERPPELRRAPVPHRLGDRAHVPALPKQGRGAAHAEAADEGAGRLAGELLQAPGELAGAEVESLREVVDGELGVGHPRLRHLAEAVEEADLLGVPGLPLGGERGAAAPLFAELVPDGDGPLHPRPEELALDGAGEDRVGAEAEPLRLPRRRGIGDEGERDVGRAEVGAEVGEQPPPPRTVADDETGGAGAGSGEGTGGGVRLLGFPVRAQRDPEPSAEVSVAAGEKSEGRGLLQGAERRDLFP